MDHFKEEIIVRKKRGWFNFFLVIITLGMIVSALLAVAFMFVTTGSIMNEFNIGALINFIVFAGILFVLFYVRVHIRVEYEYSFTNGELDVDKVYNGTKRVHMLTVDVRKIELMAPVEDRRFPGYDSDNDRQHHYAVLNRYTQTYFMAFGQGKEKAILLFEPSAEMVDIMRRYNPREIIPAGADPEAP